MSYRSRKSQVSNLQDLFFDHTSSDFCLQYPDNPPSLQKKYTRSFSRNFASKYTNFCSDQVIRDDFFIHKGFLAYINEELSDNIILLQSLSYARFSTMISTQGRCRYRVVFNKGQAFFELAFSDSGVFESFVTELKKICVCTDFHEKYTVLEILEERKKFKTCLIRSHVDRANFTAKVFSKIDLMDPQNSQQKRALINEIEALRALKGRGVFDLYEVHETVKNIYLVSEPIHDDNLQNILSNLESSYLLSKSTVQKIIFNILKALSTLASQGVIHRNIKPSNILIEDDCHVKIIHFDLATSKSALVNSLKICGTPGYLAPEVFKYGKTGVIYNEKCDIFGAGCILFEMLFGYALFEELFAGDLCFNKVSMDDIKRSFSNAVSRRKDRADSDALDLLLKLLQEDPNKRLSANEALSHPYFNDLYKQNENEETVIMNAPLDISPVMPLAYEDFTSALKLKTLLNIDSSSFESDIEDEDSQDVSDEEPELCTKYENLNARNFKKCPSMKSKTLQPFC